MFVGDKARLVSIADLILNVSGDDLECIRIAERTAILVEVYRSGKGDTLPPILVCGVATVIDGHHRILAAQAAGQTHIFATRSLLTAMMPARPIQ